MGWLRKIYEHGFDAFTPRLWAAQKVAAGTYPYLLTGCGRSGTHFTAKFLRLNGLDIGHEETAPLGCVGWLCASDRYCEERGASFARRAHQIRHPLPFIRSWQTVNPRSWHYISRYAPACLHDDPFVAAARYWVSWNQLAMRGAELSVRLEDFSEAPDTAVQRLSAFFAHPLDVELIATARGYGDSRTAHEAYGHDATLDAVKEKDPETYNALADLAARFSYAL